MYSNLSEVTYLFPKNPYVPENQTRKKINHFLCTIQQIIAKSVRFAQATAFNIFFLYRTQHAHNQKNIFLVLYRHCSRLSPKNPYVPGRELIKQASKKLYAAIITRQIEHEQWIRVRPVNDWRPTPPARPICLYLSQQGQGEKCTTQNCSNSFFANAAISATQPYGREKNPLYRERDFRLSFTKYG